LVRVSRRVLDNHYASHRERSRKLEEIFERFSKDKSPRKGPEPERKVQESSETHLQQDMLEFDKRFLIANLEEEYAKYKARRPSMTSKERHKVWVDMVGWSLEIPIQESFTISPRISGWFGGAEQLS
jgi:hypothetical protein